MQNALSKYHPISPKGTMHFKFKKVCDWTSNQSERRKKLPPTWLEERFDNHRLISYQIAWFSAGRMVSLIPVRFRLLLGLKKGCSFSLFGRKWSFEQAVVFKAQEGFLEAGLQVLLQTYIHLKTDWILMKYFSGYVERGVYLTGIWNNHRWHTICNLMSI